MTSASARAACFNDPDADGYGSGGGSCPPVADCNQMNAAVNPGVLEDLDTVYDDNCNGRTGMSTVFSATNWVFTGWTASGQTTLLSDSARLGGPAGWNAGSLTRTGLSIPLRHRIVAALDVSNRSGAGCSLNLYTSATPTGVVIAAPPQFVTGTGVQFLDFAGLIAPGRTLRSVTLDCSALSTMTFDWLQLQDALMEFAPPSEISIDWQDTRLPGGGHSVALVREDTFGILSMGSDVGGIARYEGSGTGWQVSNGEGATSILMGGTSGVTEILPMTDGSGEVYVLMGDSNNSDNSGGLWHSLDSGDSWTQLGSAVDEWPTGDHTYGTTDDIAGNPRETNCDEWVQAGGRLMQGDTIPGGTSGDIIYMANADSDARGVSIYDGTTTCALPNSGDPLPADYLGALLRVDVLPYGTPVLVVGYKARLNLGASVFVCTLPGGGLSCSGTATADCQEVTVDDGGVDVRDLEWNSWLTNVAEVTDETGVLIADGGGRPVDANSDGLPDATCTHYGGNVSQLLLSDTGGYGSVSVAVENDVLTGVDVPDIAGGIDLTGISLDLDSEYLFLNTPAGGNQRYAVDRLYRVGADDLFDAAVVSIETLNHGDYGDMNLEDYWEWLRHEYDMDMGGAWLESTINGRATVFPARAAPGDLPDLMWPDLGELAFGGDYAIGITGFGAWLVWGLTSPWLDNEPYEGTWYPSDTTADAEYDVKFLFWPDIDVVDHRTFQTASTWDAAIAPDGHVWVANGDSGLQHLDATIPATSSDPYGAEVDCLWAGWNASVNSLSVVEAVDTENYTYPVVWATMRDQSDAGINNETGVIRTMDNGATWEYAGAGFMYDDGTTPYDSMVPDNWVETEADYGYRACRNLYSDHVATPFADADPTDLAVPAHAFSSSDDPDDARRITTPSLGQTGNIEALNEYVAVVLLRPDADGGGDGGGDGGLYLTTNGGSTWELLDFDGGAGACAASTTYGGGDFHLIHPGGDSWWDPNGTDQGNLELLYSVATVAPSSSCAVARVQVLDAGAGLSTTWSWLDLPQVAPPSSGAWCGVNYDNLLGAVPAPWSDEAMIYASYVRNYGGGGTWASAVYGGACLLDLNTGATTVVVDPRTYAGGIRVATPHPQVADLWALLPETEGSYLECSTVQYAASDPLALPCPIPLPILVKGTAAGFQLVTVETSYPHFGPVAASWSDIGVSDDSADGQGTWLIVATSGGGAWRGELSW